MFKAYFFFQAHLKRGSVEKVRPHRGLLYVSTGDISMQEDHRKTVMSQEHYCSGLPVIMVISKISSCWIHMYINNVTG